MELPFNKKEPTVMHIDLNSCFASVEQQANPLLRGKPVAVVAYQSSRGCILAASVEAKKVGVKTGMRVREGKLLCPDLAVLPSDPEKYRVVHRQLQRVLDGYTDNLTPKSIDEFVLSLEGYPAFRRGMVVVAKEIKGRILSEVGEWLRVSIGIGPNRFLAKTGAGLIKPDGLEVVDASNYKEVYEGMELTDLCGINKRLASRLSSVGINSVAEMAEADVPHLKLAFRSIAAYYWYLRLRGWEIDDVEFARKSFGNSYALPKFLSKSEELAPLLMKLTEKACGRMRNAGYTARGVHIALLYGDGGFWHKGMTGEEELFDTRDVYRRLFWLLNKCPYRKGVRNLAVSCFDLSKRVADQLNLFEDFARKRKLVEAVDRVNERWGEYVITPAVMVGMGEEIVDRISFGGV